MKNIQTPTFTGVFIPKSHKANTRVVTIHIKYMLVAMARVLSNIFLHCLFGPQTTPVEHREMIFPTVYTNANDGISPFARERLDSNDVKLPVTKHPQNPYHRCVHVSDGIHPSSSVSKRDVISDIFINVNTIFFKHIH